MSDQEHSHKARGRLTATAGDAHSLTIAAFACIDPYTPYERYADERKLLPALLMWIDAGNVRPTWVTDKVVCVWRALATYQKRPASEIVDELFSHRPCGRDE